MGREFPLSEARRGYGEGARGEEGVGGSFICKNGRGYVGIGRAAERRNISLRGPRAGGSIPRREFI